MPRQAKDFEYLSCKLDKEISDKITEFCKDTARNKTAALEMILKEYLQKQGYKFTKQFSQSEAPVLKEKIEQL